MSFRMRPLTPERTNANRVFFGQPTTGNGQFLGNVTNLGAAH